MSAVLDLCDRWDALSKGETDTTRAVREAYAADVAAGVLTTWPQCGQRALILRHWDDRFGEHYTDSCVLAKGHDGAHQDSDGFGWRESIR